MYYAGIGSRQTPDLILENMKAIASYLETSNYILRSGGAIGADKAFESGVQQPHMKEIFYAEQATPDSIALASRYHPNWSACNAYVRKLHARNGLILLGNNLRTPVQFIVCWTPDGAITGGTGQALRLAIDYKIPIFNLAKPEDNRRIMLKIQQLSS